MKKITRREFLHLSALGIGTTVLATSFSACATSTSMQTSREKETLASFTHGVASGDPLSDRVILWTRAEPSNSDTDESVIMSFQVSTDPNFSTVVSQGIAQTKAERDYTVKIDVQGLSPNTIYYYRFLAKDNTSSVGKTRTLPIGDVKQVKFVVVSCSYYSAGYFHVYKEAAQESDVNAVIHLGDYIYEYGPGIYADEDAEAMDRVMQPAREILSVADYRQRYAQTRSDADLQSLHAAHPMIAIWDDHEVTNDTWKDGAENHSSNEGEFSERRLSALQAYAEWMPIRPPVNEDINLIQRDFQFGNLVNLCLLDTRLTARDEQLAFENYVDKSTGAFDGKSFAQDLHSPDRTLIGSDQLNNLKINFSKDITWQCLGQQILMGKMHLPAPIVMQKVSTENYAKIASKAQENPESLTTQELAVIKAPSIPYNLDAWDGYPAERERLLELAKDNNTNLVVLAGDTHNAWSNELTLGDELVGIEFATASVTSPGLEKYVSTTSEDEAGTTAAIAGLKYCNLVNRGFMSVTFSKKSVKSEWMFVDSVKSKNYIIVKNRGYELVHNID